MRPLRVLGALVLGAATCAPESTRRITDADTDDVRAALGARDAQTLLLFHAPWCGACRALRPSWDRLAVWARTAPDVQLLSADYTDAGLLAARFGVRMLPTVLHLWAGDVRDVTALRADLGRIFEARDAAVPAEVAAVAPSARIWGPWGLWGEAMVRVARVGRFVVELIMSVANLPAWAMVVGGIAFALLFIALLLLVWRAGDETPSSPRARAVSSSDSDESELLLDDDTDTDSDETASSGDDGEDAAPPPRGSSDSDAEESPVDYRGRSRRRRP